MSSVLIIDDDPALARVLKIGLSAIGYEVSVVLRGLDGLARVVQDQPDLLVVDLGLPDVDGVSLVAELRRYHTKGLVVLSAAGDELTKVKALDRGADDYITKPFGMREFEARLRALERRMDSAVVTTKEVVAGPGLRIDLGRRIVVDEARGFLSLPRPDPAPDHARPSSSAPAGSPESARRLFATSQPISGTIAETYLRRRGITALHGTANLRFHPS
jgi:two-component system KDP operon response regulator KdpE